MKKLYTIAFLLLISANCAKAQFQPRYGDTIQDLNPDYFGCFDPTDWFAQDTIKKYWERRLVGWYTCDTIISAILVNDDDGSSYIYYDTDYVQCPIYKWDSVYHRIHHDLVYYLEPRFGVDGHCKYPDLYWNDEMVGRYTNRPLKIIGIAGQIGIHCYYRDTLTGSTISQIDAEEYLDSMEHYLLYEVGPDSLVCRIDLPWRRISNDSSRYINTALRPPVITCCAKDSTVYRTLRYQESYLERPVFVTDSFYIGATQRYRTNFTHPRGGFGCKEALYGAIGSSLTPHLPTCPRYNAMSADTCPSAVALPAIGRNIRPTRTLNQLNIPVNTWYRNTEFCNALPLIFPIVEDMCPEASELHVTRSTPDSTFITWRAAYSHTLWEVAYTKEGYPVDSLHRDTLAVSHYELSGLDSNANYIFRVKAFCPYHLEGRDSAIMGFSDSTYVSEWSDSLSFLFGAISDTTSHEPDTIGIQHPAIDAESITLVPNPATNMVSISSTLRIASIEILNLQGQLMETLPIGATKVQINVTRFDPGAYLLRIHTSQGVATKKLVVR